MTTCPFAVKFSPANAKARGSEMPKIRLIADKLVGYARTNLTPSGIVKLGSAKLGCSKRAAEAEAEAADKKANP